MQRCSKSKFKSPTHLPELLTLKRRIIPSTDENVTSGTHVRSWSECKMVLTKLNPHLTHDPTILLLHIYCRGMIIHMHTNLNGNAYSDFIHNHQKLGTNQKSLNKQINKWGHTHDTERSSGIKRKGPLTHTMPRMTFQSIMLRKRSQTQKPHTIPFHLNNIFKNPE